jgi:colanic acid/amylovoran biosynthesis protein
MEGDKMSKIFIYTHGGSYNHGCEAIVRGTNEILKEKTKMFLFSKNVQSEIRNGVDELYIIKRHLSYKFNYSPKRIFAGILRKVFKNTSLSVKIAYSPVINSATENDIAISVGGDMYCYNSYHWIVELNKFLKEKNVLLVLWGCSIEPSALNDYLVKHLKEYDFITCRESITYNALIENGVKNVKLFPDPAFVLKPDKISLDEHPILKNKTIGINVSPLLKVVSREDLLEKNIIKLIEYIIKKTNYDILLIPHVDHEEERYYSERDYTYMKKFFQKILETEKRVKLLFPNYNAEQLKYIISKCNMFIGSRTHATIAAYSSCVPTQVIGYSIKSKGIAKDIFGTYENYVLPINRLKSEDDLIEGFIWLMKNEKNIRKHLESFMPDYVKKAYEAKEVIDTMKDKVKENTIGIKR